VSSSVCTVGREVWYLPRGRQRGRERVVILSLGIGWARVRGRDGRERAVLQKNLRPAN
jgi:hypothetical protein